jgi:hypothetical protein
MMRKYRYSYSKEYVQRITSKECHTYPRPLLRNDEAENILWKLDVERFYSSLPKVNGVDIPFHEKMDKAVFRGGPAGFASTPATLFALCFSKPRCEFVYKWTNRSDLVDAKMVGAGKYGNINGVQLEGPGISMEGQLKYKALIVLEGNDCATGTKWAMYSNSVLIMPKPKFTSYLMEEILEPWVHYVPIASDFSDVEEKVKWVIDNSAYAERIAQRATMWMNDLEFHEDSQKDRLAIEDEMMGRYQRHFRWDDSLETNQ